MYKHFEFFRWLRIDDALTVSNTQIIHEIQVFIKFKFLNKFSRVPRRNLYRRFNSSVALVRCVRANSTSGKSLWITDGGVVAFFGNGRKIRDSATPRRLEEARLDGRRICSQPDRNEIQSVTFSFPSSCLRLETSDSVIDICAFSCASCFPRVPPFFFDSTFGEPSRRLPFVFPTAFRTKSSFEKIPFFHHSVSLSGYPFFISQSSCDCDLRICG